VQSAVKKKTTFKIVLFFIPFILILSIELFLRLFHYEGKYDLFIPASAPYTQYKKINPDVARRYFFRQSTLPRPANDIFLANKPDSCYRIFVLGGSTALGFPYGNLVMFSRILQKRLQDTFPDTRIEIINVALTAINSYTLLDFLDEILREKPDALLIYAGHNEYYGALGVGSLESFGPNRRMVLAFLKLNRFKIFLLMRNLIGKVTAVARQVLQRESYNPFGTLMERLVTKQEIPYGSDLFEKGEIQFRGNLSDIFSKAQKQGVPVIISELVSNVHDQTPFISAFNDSFPPADMVFRQAQQLEKQENREAAKQAYYKAKDLDELRFRAPEDLNTIIHQVADQYHSAVVPMKVAFERASPNGIPGDGLMVDHLHPNIDGYFLMADAFYRTMRSRHLIDENWDSAYALPADYYRATWPITALDSTIADLTVKQLKGGWPFKPQFSENRTLLDFKPGSMLESLALKVIFDEIKTDEAHFMLAKHFEESGNIKAAIKEYDALTHLLFIEAYIYLDRAKAFIRASENDRALYFLHKSLQQEEIPLANRLAGEIYIKKGEYDKAIYFLERAYHKIPDNPSVLYDLCIAYVKQGQSEKANHIYRIYAQKFSDDHHLAELKNIVRLN
jgi:lysophospholipase L1-like esterase/thioredoxin-like negative regulator of GroEL